MGQKVNPHGLRVGVIKDWDSRWYAREDKVGDLIVEDYKIREFLKKTLYSAGVPTIEIERDSAKVRIYIHCSRPGVVIGKGGEQIEKLRQDVEKMIGKSVALSIVEVRTPDTNAQLVAENIAQQLEKRIGFRRAMKNAMGRAMRMGARGIKVKCGGRLGGAEIARSSAAAVSAAPRSPAASATTRAPSPCRPSAPTSSTALPRRTPPTAASASRSGSTRARSSPRLCAPPRAPWTCPSPPATAVAETTAAADAVTTAVRAIGAATTATTAASRARAATAVRLTAAGPRARAATTVVPVPPLPRKEAKTNVNA